MASDVTCTAGDNVYNSGEGYVGTKLDMGQHIVHCATDFHRTAYATVQVETGGFSKCLDACDDSENCVGWTFSGTDSGQCYLKDGAGAHFLSSDNIVSGFRLQKPTGLTTSTSYEAPKIPGLGPNHAAQSEDSTHGWDLETDVVTESAMPSATILGQYATPSTTPAPSWFVQKRDETHRPAFRVPSDWSAEDLFRPIDWVQEQPPCTEETCTSTIEFTSTQFYGPYGESTDYPAWVTSALPLAPPSTVWVTQTSAGYVASPSSTEVNEDHFKRHASGMSKHRHHSPVTEPISKTPSYTETLYHITPSTVTTTRKLPRSAAQRLVASYTTSSIQTALPTFASTGTYTYSFPTAYQQPSVSVMPENYIDANQPAGDNSFCWQLRHLTPLHLRTNVIKGPKIFGDQYIDHPIIHVDSKRVDQGVGLTRDPDAGAHIFLTPENGVLSNWDSREQQDDGMYYCNFMGLALMERNATAAPDPHGDVTYFQNAGTKGMVQKNKAFVWDNPRFGGWLVCRTGSESKMRWWDLSTEMEPDFSECALVELLPAKYKHGEY